MAEIKEKEVKQETPVVKKAEPTKTDKKVVEVGSRYYITAKKGDRYGVKRG